MKKIIPVYNRANVLAIPVPEQTETYTPVSAQLIFQTIDEVCEELGLVISEEEFLLHGNGERQRMRFFFNVPGSDFTKELVLISSYDKSIALRAASGTSVFVCKNGTILGDIKIYRKHTGTVDEELKQFLIDSLLNMQEIYQYAEESRDKYKSIILSKEDISLVLGQCFFEFEYLSSTQLNIVKKEFDKPSFDYKSDPMSMWSFYNHLTLAVNGESPSDYLENRRGIQELIVNLYHNKVNDSYEEYDSYEVISEIVEPVEIE